MLLGYHPNEQGQSGMKPMASRCTPHSMPVPTVYDRDEKMSSGEERLVLPRFWVFTTRQV
ncbi:MAG TPA: hypothetical protein G4O07_09260 [Dehalococcoidia bacterium]|nr:hypothetical protein [Dehalococcoidia bacterium]